MTTLDCFVGDEALEASQHDIQLEDGDLEELDDNFSDLSDSGDETDKAEVRERISLVLSCVVNE